jgi:hypothetical protein
MPMAIRSKLTGFSFTALATTSESGLGIVHRGVGRLTSRVLGLAIEVLHLARCFANAP